LEYISKLIKNNKKHFEKDHANEEVIANLKQCNHILFIYINSFVILI